MLSFVTSQVSRKLSGARFINKFKALSPLSESNSAMCLDKTPP